MEHAEVLEAENDDGASRDADEQAQLRSVLHQWNPVKIDENRQADRGKYDPLIVPILARLSSDTTVAALAEYLWFEARDHLGIDPERSRSDLLAEHLIAWYRSRDARR